MKNQNVWLRQCVLEQMISFYDNLKSICQLGAELNRSSLMSKLKNVLR